MPARYWILNFMTDGDPGREWIGQIYRVTSRGGLKGFHNPDEMLDPKHVAERFRESGRVAEGPYTLRDAHRKIYGERNDAFRSGTWPAMFRKIKEAFKPEDFVRSLEAYATQDG